MKKIIKTSRLYLREFDPMDAEQLYFLNSDPEVLKYTGDQPFTSEDKARQFLLNYNHYSIYGFGRWAVIKKDSGEFLGWCGLKYNEEKLIDLGFRFFEKYWHQGFASESAKASIKHGFEKLQMKSIVGRSSKENKASIKVLEKSGMSFWKYGKCKGIENAIYFKIDQENYFKTKRPSQ